MSWDADIEEIKRRRELAKQQGGKEAVARHHEKGRLTIRERIATLLDADSFNEVGEGAGLPEYDDDGQLTDFQPANFVLGFGEIGGRRVIVGGEDFTLKGGSPNPAGLRKSVYAEQLALQFKVPLIRLHEGGGGSVGGTGQEKTPSLGRTGIFDIALCATGRNAGACSSRHCRAGPGCRIAGRTSRGFSFFRYDRKCRRFNCRPTGRQARFGP